MPLRKNNAGGMKKYIVFLIVFICLAVVIESMILSSANRKQADKSTKLMLNQVIEALEVIEAQESDGAISAGDAHRRIDIIVGHMPVYEGLYIYVSEMSNNVVIGSTTPEDLGKTLYEIGIADYSDDFSVLTSKEATYNGFKHFCVFHVLGGHLVTVVHSTRANLESYFISMLSMLTYLSLAAAVIIFVLHRLSRANEEANERLAVLVSMADIYYTMHMINLKENTVHEYSTNETVKAIVNNGSGADAKMKQIISETTTNEYLDEALQFTDLTTLADRMRGKKSISMNFKGTVFGWCAASFITIEAEKDGRPSKVIFVTKDINELKIKEEQLLKNSRTDEVTGLPNRRAYEEDIAVYEDVAPEGNFVYVSMDINSLKYANDRLGHAAGDELLLGATGCMIKCFGPYGKVYRTGGDEFVAILSVDDEQMKAVKKEFLTSLEQWHGTRIRNVSVSCGYISRVEAKTSSIKRISRMAEQRMYQEKARYYEQSGMDRRKRKED